MAPIEITRRDALFTTWLEISIGDARRPRGASALIYGVAESSWLKSTATL
jgi:hypothetical protein